MERSKEVKINIKVEEESYTLKYLGVMNCFFNMTLKEMECLAFFINQGKINRYTRAEYEKQHGCKNVGIIISKLKAKGVLMFDRSEYQINNLLIPKGDSVSFKFVWNK